MIYRQFEDLTLPMLAFGTMRLPVAGGVDANIDKQRTKEMINYAIDHGVNYFDTAWGYHGGNSESVVGELLCAYPRESFYLADKFPGYDLSNMNKAEEIFEEQLRKCKVEYFDFYLFHNVCELNIDAYLDESYGIMDYLLKQKEQGRIKHLGFSAHGSYEVLTRFLDGYGTHMEFCQLQVNWLDWTLQESNKKVELMNSHGIPVWVMEPLRGGALASLSEPEEAKLKQLRPDESVPGWAYRFLQSIPGVALVISGQSTLEQLQENIVLFEEEQPLTSEEDATLQSVVQAMTRETSIPCTACRYCIDYCPQELDIPTLLKLYNQRRFTGASDFIAPMAVAGFPEDKQPSACTGCRSCEAVCPQQLKVASAMEDFTQMLAKQE